MSSLPFQLAGGSVLGLDHRRGGKNNQDAYGWRCQSGAIVAVVCDGCGSMPHSEVGAKLGVNLVLKSLLQSYDRYATIDDPQLWQDLHRALLDHLQILAQCLGENWQHRLREYFLFTLVGALITPDRTVIFALGDGVAIVNNHPLVFPPFPNNAPPYLAYGLLSTSFTPDQLALQRLHSLATADLHSLLLGSDGVAELQQMALSSLPGQRQRVGDVAQFWQDDRYFRNPDQVRRTLTLMNRETTTVSEAQGVIKYPGLLRDDTTLITLRRCLERSPTLPLDQEEL